MSLIVCVGVKECFFVEKSETSPSTRRYNQAQAKSKIFKIFQEKKK